MKNLTFVLIGFLGYCMQLSAQSPERLAVYYGWPLTVNESNYDSTKIIDAFDEYDLIVFGGGLIDNLSGTDKTLFENVISGLDNGLRKVFGYVTISPNTYNKVSEIETRVQAWKAMGLDGIFLDEAGMDYGTKRSRQDSVVKYIHGEGMPVMLNAWNPRDALSGTPELGHNSAIRDYFMLESFMISSSAKHGFVDFGANDAETGARYQAALNAKNSFPNLGVVTLTTTKITSFYECQFQNAWWATMAYGFDAMGWGEINFSAGNAALNMANRLPYRNRPIHNPTLTGSPSVSNTSITRNTNQAGSITVNPQNHHISFTENGNTVFSIDNLVEDCGEVYYIDPNKMADRCVPTGLGSSQFGIYVKSDAPAPGVGTTYGNNGQYVSDCECYNQVSGTANMSILKSNGRWVFLFAPNCVWKNEGSADIAPASSCNPGNDLQCIEIK